MKVYLLDVPLVTWFRRLFEVLLARQSICCHVTKPKNEDDKERCLDLGGEYFLREQSVNKPSEQCDWLMQITYGGA